MSKTVVSRGFSTTGKFFINTSDVGLFRSLFLAARGSNGRPLVCHRHLPAFLNVGFASVISDNTTLEPETLASVSIEIEFTSPFNRFVALNIESTERAAIMLEHLTKWGYDPAEFMVM
jgi:hypothetical protein